MTPEFPKNGKSPAPYSHLLPDALERQMSSDWLDSTKRNASRLPGRVGNRWHGDIFPNRHASRQQHFFPSRGLVFLFGQFTIGLQNHSKGIAQVFTGFFQRFALSMNAGNFLNRGGPPPINTLKRGCQLHAVIIGVLLAFVQPLSAGAITQKPLDELVIYDIPVAFKSGNTTFLFPSPISGLYAKSVATQEQPNADFLISFTPGNFYFTVRALKAGAEDHLTVIYNRKAYVLHLVASENPDYSVTFFQELRRRQDGPRSIVPERLLSLLDKVKAYALFQKEHPEALAGVIHVTSKDGVSHYENFNAHIRDVWRFEEEDTLIFRLDLENTSDHTIYYKPQDLAVRLDHRIYTQSIADASGVMPPKSTTPAFFAITGDGEGGRNNLAPDNAWNVLVVRDTKGDFK